MKLILLFNMKLSWPILSCIAVLSFSVMVTLISFVTRRGISVPLMLLSVSIVVIPFYFIQMIHSGGLSPLAPSSILLLICIGVMSGIGNIAQFEAVKNAPNPGLPLTIVGFYSALVAIIAVFVFKDKLTFLQIVGILTALVGVSLISLSGKT
jgi:drug/metabolite transporter (DMT)-like permease